ncbi:MAG: phytoene desaturase family protein [Actinomycetota bacterium]
MTMDAVDATVVGSGPNGLAAAIALARAGHSVRLFEAHETVGGGTRSAELTLPGFVHDVCSAVHPLGPASPYLRRLPLGDHGLEWIYPPVPFAHPLDDGTAVLLQRSVVETAAGFGVDAGRYRTVMAPLVAGWEGLSEELLAPARVPRHPLLMARFGALAPLPAQFLADRLFRGERAKAIFAGAAGHAILPLNKPMTSAFGLMFEASAHAVGWPIARGGSQRIADALASYLRSLGGEILNGTMVTSIDELPASRAYLFDTSPEGLVRIAGARLPDGYRRRLLRFRHGPGAFKVDYALDGPVPWKAEECLRTATVHLGGTLPEIADAEAAVGRGDHPERPLVLVAQPTLFDPSRAPEGKHVLWAYCHTPAASTFDMTERITAQIERFAPGFRDRILAQHVLSPADLEAYNPNYVGGDIAGGGHGGLQARFRPVVSLDPYATAAEGVFICSSSTPPGAGVHGMCGYWAAQSALRHLRGS